ncbi:MAG: hypothetical protein HY078_11275 [Elusimicrobia bacterium]|nr:hypothetical protein [Elusimicrobiota bacterium]
MTTRRPSLLLLLALCACAGGPANRPPAGAPVAASDERTAQARSYIERALENPSHIRYFHREVPASAETSRILSARVDGDSLVVTVHDGKGGAPVSKAVSLRGMPLTLEGASLGGRKNATIVLSKDPDSFLSIYYNKGSAVAPLLKALQALKNGAASGSR